MHGVDLVFEVHSLARKEKQVTEKGATQADRKVGSQDRRKITGQSVRESTLDDYKTTIELSYKVESRPHRHLNEALRRQENY